MTLIAAGSVPAAARRLRIPLPTARVLHRALPFALPLLLLVLWEIVTRAGLISPMILPRPAEVLGTGIAMIQDGELVDALRVSLGRVVAGFALGAALGIAIGGAMGLSHRVEAYLGPTVRAICLVPTIGWLPFFMLLFGIGEGLKIAIIVKGCFQPFAINTLAGIRSVSSRYHDVARVLEFGRWRTVRRVIFPAALPYIFGGGRMALGQAWMVLVTAEMLASAEGIGYVMSWARLQFQLDVLLVAMIAVGLAGWTIDAGARLLESRIGGWYGHGTAETSALPANSGSGWRGVVLPAVLVALWVGAGAAGLINGRTFVTLPAVIDAASRFIASGDAAQALGSSLARFIAGWILGSVLGLLLGLAIGLSRWGEAFAGGSFHAVRQIALFAWIPLITAWFGQGEAARVIFVVIATVFPVALNTQIGCRTVPMRYREVARVLEFGLIQTIRRVVLPAAAPSILAGLQLGLVSAWIGTVGAEYLIESGVGLGVSISGARELNDLATVIVGVLLLGLIGLLLDRIARVAASRLITGRTA